MTRTELLESIRNGDSSGVEFKRETEDPRLLAEALVAFANLRGGRVLLGVDTNRTVSGLTRVDSRTEVDGIRTYDRLEEWVMQACRDKIRPEIIPYFEVVRDVEPGRDIAIVEVEPGWNVHHVWHDQHRTYYIRVGTLSREASPEELQRLFQQRGSLRSEIRPVSGSSIEDLDQRRLVEYFERVRMQGFPVDDSGDGQRRERESLLVHTGFLDSGDRHPATVAALLLFGKNPKRHLPQAGIDAAAYDGLQEYAVRERTSLRGPMVVLRAAGGAVVEPGLVEEAVAFVRRNTTPQATLVDGARRQDRWDYPEEAVREAIVNALVHRDYLLSGTDIELSVYSDRLEVVSPGRLPNGITPERMLVGARAARNQLLKDVMRDYGYLEHMGMGVPRKIVKLMREQNGTEPELIEDGERFIVRLWKQPKLDRDAAMGD